MNNRQRDTCYRKLQSVDSEAAEYFARLVNEAIDTAARARKLREMAWSVYHRHFAKQPSHKRHD